MADLPALTPSQLEALFEAGCAAQALTPDPGWRSGILAHLAALGAAARLVQGFAVDDAVEPAPVFRA
jgi:hypothetical protein